MGVIHSEAESSSRSRFATSCNELAGEKDACKQPHANFLIAALLDTASTLPSIDHTVDSWRVLSGLFCGSREHYNTLVLTVLLGNLDCEAAAEWVADKCKNLESRLAENDGLLKITDFLPDTIAEAINNTLGNLPEVCGLFFLRIGQRGNAFLCRICGSSQKQRMILPKIISTTSKANVK